MMNANSAFHFFSGGMAAKHQLFEVGDIPISFVQADAAHLHIHGFVLSNSGGDACTVTFSDEDGTAFLTYTVAADDSVAYEGVPFHIDNGLTITPDAGAGTPAIRWSVAYCGELIQR